MNRGLHTIENQVKLDSNSLRRGGGGSTSSFNETISHRTRHGNFKGAIKIKGDSLKGLCHQKCVRDRPPGI
jgi:hypothetical protein